jgi:hypothetical protein
VIQGNVLLCAQALTYPQRLGIAIAINVLRHRIAKVLPQGAMGHI